MIGHAAVAASGEMGGRQQGGRGLRRERLRAHIDAVVGAGRIGAQADHQVGRTRRRIDPHAADRAVAAVRRLAVVDLVESIAPEKC